MFINSLPPLGPFGVTCYIVTSENMNGVLIDAPEDSSRISRELKEKGIKLKMILLTHGHCDHIASAARLSRETGARIYIHSEDMGKLTNDGANLSAYFRMPPVEHIPKAVPLEDGQVITMDELEFEVLHTPGHTSGSVCYILGENMFCGDTLFKESMGRTDMPDGDEDVMTDTLCMLYEFDPQTDYQLYPGHGEQSTMSYERESNPYMKYAHKKSAKE